MTRYLTTHTVRTIVARIDEGLWNMVTTSYDTFWYAKYVVMYLAFGAVLVVTCWPAFLDLIRRHAAAFAFVLLYGVVYLLASAFYNPISATGTTRYLLTHLTPLLFVLTYFASTRPFSARRWRIGAAEITPAHFQLLLSATVALDLVFTLWPRLMSTYGGF